MTEQQQRWIAELSRCTFLPGSYDKRFVRNLAAYSPDRELTPRQANALHQMAYRYRRQRGDPTMPQPKIATSEYTAALKTWIKGE